MPEMLFHYFPAFVADVIDANTVRVWLQHPAQIGWNKSRTIVVDISNTPSKPGLPWDHIEVDDYAEHPDPDKRGFTSLGPVFPHVYGALGLYLSKAYVERNSDLVRDALADRPGTPAGAPHEYLAFVRAKSGGGFERYHGFAANEIHTFAVGKLYLVAHAGTSQTRRARVPVLVTPKDTVEVTTSWPGEAAPTGKLFLDATVAANAGVDVPKKPTGSGERKWVPVGTSGPLHLFEPSPLHGELGLIRQKVATAACIEASRTDLAAELQRCEGTFSSLDVIAHARAKDGALRFDNLPLTAKGLETLFTKDVISALQVLQVKAIRLLGCLTGASPSARDALATFRAYLHREGLDVEVYGTSADVFAVHYDGTGFIERRLLVPAPPETTPHALPLASESTTVDPSPHVVAWDAADVTKLWTHVDDGTDTSPLEVASRQVLVVVPTGPVRAFDLMSAAPGTDARPPLRGIRLNRDGAWTFHALRGSTTSDDLYRLLGL